MSKFTRRDALKLGVGATAAAGLSPLVGDIAPAAAQDFTAEPGASLRLLRFSAFVKGEDEAWVANTKRFTEKTGVEVSIERESYENIRPKATVAANVGSGPDIMFVWFDDPFQYPDQLLDVSALAEGLGQRFGGWYDGPRAYTVKDGKWFGLPLAVIGNAICYRESWIKEAGFPEFPKETKGFLELCKALNARGHPPGFTHGHAVGDANNHAHWLLWSHGGKMVDESSKVTINSPETIHALKYAAELYKTFIPGTASWLDTNNNRAFLAGEISLTGNSVSIHYVARNDPKLADIAKDIRTVSLPIGPIGKPVELHQTVPVVIFKYTKFPKAAQAYLQFMFEESQMNAWLAGSSAFCCQTLKAYASHPIWTSDPNHAPYSKVSESLRPNGYAGPLGYASAAVMAEYLLVDMFAECVTGQRTPEEAAKRAETRANHYYRV